MKLRGETPEEDIELGLTTGGIVTKSIRLKWLDGEEIKV